MKPKSREEDAEQFLLKADSSDADRELTPNDAESDSNDADAEDLKTKMLGMVGKRMLEAKTKTK